MLQKVMAGSSSRPSQTGTEARWPGRPVVRSVAGTLLIGRGQYTDDLPVRAGTLHAAVLRSPHAHAEILGINASKAKARPGVMAVLTGREIKEDSDPFLIVLRHPMDQWSLAVDRVRFVGGGWAAVVAEDPYLAEGRVCVF